MVTTKDLINDILRTEGGYVNHASDRGGPTNFGVTIKTYSKWRGFKVTIDQLRNMSRDDACSIYTTNYFKRPKIDKLPVELHGQVLDCSVNHGPKRAIKLLQKTLNDNYNYNLVVDGILGKFTIGVSAHEQESSGCKLTNNLVDNRVSFYKRIVKKDKTQHVFLKGWLKRANSFRLQPC